MRLLNLGCGSHYVVSPDWTNVDFNSNDLHVISHDLSQGIPFKDNTFDMIYHSHVLEHFSKSDGVKFVNECFRVLKPGGILRVAIPDLEQITRNYLKFLELGLKDPHDPLIEANYDWMLLEMYDQTVRNISGGEMLKYLHQENLINEEFIYERIGEEGKSIRNAFLNYKKNKLTKPQKKNRTLFSILSGIKQKIFKTTISSISNSTQNFSKVGEIHLWMYDKYSLRRLLTNNGFKNISFVTAFDSNLPDWKKFELDGKNGIIRKPDSLFTEAFK